MKIIRKFFFEFIVLLTFIVWYPSYQETSGKVLRDNAICLTLLKRCPEHEHSLQQRNKSHSKTWVDPSAIIRAKLPLSDKVLTLIRASIGGFGIGSDFAWQLQSYVRYPFSSVFHASIEYRVISTEYDKGSEEDRFLYYIVSLGPVLRIGFNF